MNYELDYELRRKNMPRGIDDYKEIVDRGLYYADKTMLVKDLIDGGSNVVLFTRPRRFGKTINMSMLKYYFEKTEEDNTYLFEDKLIWQQGEKYLNHFGKYPVIFMTFKDIKEDSFEKMTKKIKEIISNVFVQIYKNNNIYEKLLDVEKLLFDSIMCQTAEQGRYENSLLFITEILNRQYKEKAIIIIDEYDTPINTAHVRGYEREALDFMRNFLSAGLKGNVSLYKGILTGINRVGKENIFSGLNNLSVYSVFDNWYAEYFGLTEEEVKKAFEYAGREFTEEVKKWYNGYKIGGIELYNPWSIISYLQYGKFEAYWVNTSSNDLIVECVKNSDMFFKENIKKLMENEPVKVSIEKEITFERLNMSENIYGLFMNAGYLTLENHDESEYEEYSVKIPNNEVVREFKKIITISINTSTNNLNMMFDALRNKEIGKFKMIYKDIVKSTISYYDVKENAYHMFMLGMCVALKDKYEVKSNLEAGDGRADIICIPKEKGLSPIIMEFKYSKKETDLEELSKEAIEQIKQREYYADFKDEEVIIIGIGHYKKQCEIAMEIVIK